MSARNPETDYSQVSNALAFWFDQFGKDRRRALPATIVSYNAQTRRAVVQPANKITFNDGREAEMYAPLADIPCILPSAGGYTVNLPIEAGDPVMLLVSDRGFAQFKKTYQDGTEPDKGIDHTLKDCVAFVGFGTLETTPARDGAVSIQSVDGSRHVALDGNTAYVKAPTIRLEGNVVITGTTTCEANVDVTGDIAVSGDVDGVDVSEHTHGGVRVGTANTQEPN